jgi:hypothetical protein
VEQFEASMVRAFIGGLIIFITLLVLGHPTVALILGLLHWWMGYWWMGIAGWLTAWLRGESPYGGAHFEEAAYAIDELYEVELRKIDG